MANVESLSDLLRQQAFYESGGKPEGGRDIDKVNAIFGTIKNGVTGYQDIIKNVLAKKKAELENQKSEIEIQSGRRAVQPIELTAGSRNVPGMTAGTQIPSRTAGVEGDTIVTSPQVSNLPEELKPFGKFTTDETSKLAGAQASLERVNNPRAGSNPLSLRPAIGSGYASREFVKSIFPEIGDTGDVSIGELQQRLGIYKTQLPQQVGGEQLDKIVILKNAITGAQDIKDQFFSMIAEGQTPVDPISGRWELLKGKFGFQTDDERIKFQTDLRGQLNTYLNALSGAALTVQEAERLRARLPDIDMTEEQFLARMDSFEKELKRSLSNRIQTLGEANYKTAGLDKYIIKPEPSNDVGGMQSKATETIKKGIESLETFLSNPKIPDALKNKARAAKRLGRDTKDIIDAIKIDAGLK